METRELTPEQDALEHIRGYKDKSFLEERYIGPFKGKGVFTNKTIEPSEFVVEYRGILFRLKSQKRKTKYGDTIKNHYFEFSWKDSRWSIDGSTEDGTLGKLVNDDHFNPNCELKKIDYEEEPHLCLFALRKISPGEEITFDYGESSYPWRAMLEAASCFENFCDDDNDDDGELPESGPSRDKTNTRPDYREYSPLSDYDSSQEMPETSARQDDTWFPDQEEADDDVAVGAKRKQKNKSSFRPKNYCYVCGKGYAKIGRHLNQKHADEEPDIAEAFKCRKNSRERWIKLLELRNRGNYKHNQQVLKNNSGTLKLKRESISVEAGAKTHVHCLYCKGMFHSKNMWRHVARCTMRKTSESKTGGKTNVLSEIALAESPFAAQLSSGVWKILSTMKQDDIACAIQNDFLLLKLAQHLFVEYGRNQTKHDYIRQKLRELGRVLLALREKTISSFEDAIKVENFSKVVEAVKDIAGFDEETQSYNKPSLALKLGHSLKKMGAMVLGGVEGNEEGTSDTKTFMDLCAKEWSQLVSQTAAASLSGQNVSSPSTIPFTLDVQVFYKYLETSSASAMEGLLLEESQPFYNELCRVTLAQASVLNKCASAVSKLTLKAFQDRDDATKVLSKHFMRINTLSSTGQNVAVLLTSELASAIMLLVSRREACGVHPDNPFLFAKPNSSPKSLYHGGNCIRAFSCLCRAKNPEHLRAARLHKHIARLFQILNMENDELEPLAELLGREIPLDRDYYRLPEAAVDLAKIAQLLLAMEKGSLEDYKGKSLDEIEVEDELEADVEQEAEEADAEEDNEESDLLLQQTEDVMEKQRKEPTPEEDALEHIKSGSDKQFLEGIFIDPFKGRGVFTHESIKPSSFVAEFRGITTLSESETLRKKRGDTLNEYVFDFSWNGTNWSIDASKEDKTIGRLVNDDNISPNCKIKKIVFEGKPHVCLFASKEISAGEEITFNYGNSSYRWRSTAGSLSSAESGCDDCDDEYVPEEEPSSSKKHKQRQEDNLDPSSSEQQPDNEELEFSSDDFTSDEEPENIPRRNRNYCYVCGAGFIKLSRHLLTHRKEEPDIAKVFSLPALCMERIQLLEELRNKGNNEHNRKVLETRCGELKVKRISSSPVKTFAVCLYCKGMYCRRDMFRHMQRCSSKKARNLPTVKTLTLVNATELTQENTADVMKVLKAMKNDEITKAVCNDSHTLQLAQYLCNMSKCKDLLTTKQRLRIVGRLLLSLKEKSICNFKEAVKPENFDKVLEVVREIAGGVDEEMKVLKPAAQRLQLKLGNALKSIADINMAIAIKEDAGEQALKDAETFMKLCAKEWGAVRPLSKQANNPPTVPFTQDVQCFYQFMEKTSASAVESLTKYESPQVYNALLRVTVAQVSTLNKNVDFSKVTLKSFVERDQSEPHDDSAAASQSESEQILCKHSVKMNVASETGRKCAVTLTPRILTAIALLAEKRVTCGVLETNPLLFARPVAKCTSVFKDLRCIASFVDRCGAKHASDLRSLFYRKYIVRVFQILSLTDDDLDELANLLRRNIRTDKEFYRTPEAAVDIAKILELLSAMENGSFEKFDGKSFEEMEIADGLERDVENHDAEEDGNESESSPELSGSARKKAGRRSRVPSSSRKRVRGKRSKSGAEPEASEPQEAIESNNEAKESNQEAIDSNHEAIDSNHEAIDSNHEAIESNHEAIESNHEAIESNQEAIESKHEAIESNQEADNKVNTEKDGGSEEMPESFDIDTPNVTMSLSNADVTKMSFSDIDEEDMNVDFDMDIDTDDDIPNNNPENIEDNGTTGSVATPWIPDGEDVTEQDSDRSDAEEKNGGSPNMDDNVSELEDTMETDDDEGNRVEEEDQEKEPEQNKGMDSDSRSSSPILNTEKTDKGSAAVTGLKEVKILLRRLDIEKLRGTVRISELSSMLNLPEKDPPNQKEENDRVSSDECPASPPSTEPENKPSDSDAKAVQMSCSHCKKSMLKGQTAYQKKGFTDVFCSKDCLFEMFPINKPVTKTCYYCHKAILQPIDLIMAAVDVKGTMKDFCSPTCLCSFKFPTVSTPTPQLSSVCRACNKSCTTTCELTVDQTLHKFCSDSCLEDFRSYSRSVCENCHSHCLKKPLILNLQQETKTFCTHKCLGEFKKQNTKNSLECTVCKKSRPMSEMFNYLKEDNMVELFCNPNCVTSYRASYKLLENGSESQLNKRKRSWPIKRISDKESSPTVPVSIANDHKEDPPPTESDTPIYTITRSGVVCCHCDTRLPVGEMFYQMRNSRQVLCSASCLSEKYPHIKVDTKHCYNCLKVIDRPKSMIRVPVDDLGTMKELCGNACLASVNSRRGAKPLRKQCGMCHTLFDGKDRWTLGGSVTTICSETCFINFHKVHNLPVLVCEVCGSLCPHKWLSLKTEDGTASICNDQCLVKYKEAIETPQLCPMCQTSHQMSDMVERRNEEGRILDFFCSNRCMMVHKAQALTVTGKSASTLDEIDVKEVKPSLLSLGCIKEEPIDEDCKEDLLSVPTENIKDESNVVKCDSAATESTQTSMDLPASCSHCQKVLLNGETVYQRKNHVEIFCSTSCLLKTYQMKTVKKTCHFCLQTVTQTQEVEAPVDSDGTKTYFCSPTCLSSSRNMSAKKPIAPPAPSTSHPCRMCNRDSISKHEIIEQDVVHHVCSDACFLRICQVNKLFFCKNCRSHCWKPLFLNMEHESETLCTTQCLAQFKQKIQTPQSCAMCCTSHPISEMVEDKNSENVVELFCSSCCVTASKIQASGIPLKCDHCGQVKLPTCHLAMADSSIRNFCTVDCAMAFEKKTNAATNPAGRPDQTKCEFLLPPDKLPCAQCQSILQTTPKVVQQKGKMKFVCSLACSQEYKKLNNMVGRCEYCQKEKVVTEAKRIDGQDCYFCNDGCKMLYCNELEKKWGDHCHSCAYCLSTSQKVVTRRYEGLDQEFCSEECNRKYNTLSCHVAKCDTCGREGKLRQSLPLLGEVKHFCDLNCVLHFCNGKVVQLSNTVSSLPGSEHTAASSPIIANVISLAGALARQPRASASSTQHVSLPDIKTHVVGHASVQTVSPELKNKSTLCTPLVHNKGISCRTQTVDTETQTETQTETSNPRVIVLPVPVPVYVPLPLNMYSQYTPRLLGLPVPLPVPLFVPVSADRTDLTLKPTKKKIHPEEEELDFQCQTEKTEQKKNEREDKEGEEMSASKEESRPTTPLLEQPARKVHNKNKGRKMQQPSTAAQDDTEHKDLSSVSRKNKLTSGCGIDAWRRWTQWRDSQTDMDLAPLTLNEDIIRCSATELSDALCCFIDEAKQPDGEPYSPDSLFYLCLSIQQHLFESGRLENIFSDHIYKKFSLTFTKVLKGFKASVTARGYVHSRVEEDFLWDCKQLGAYSPIVLLNTLLFFFCKFFGFSAVEQHRQLSFAHVMRCTKTNQNNSKTTFLRFYPPISTTETEAEAETDADGVPAKKRKKTDRVLEMPENTENPLRCPVRLYRFYLSKCPESVRQRNDLFYLQPNGRCVPSSPLWFSRSALDTTKMDAMIVRSLAVRELQERDNADDPPSMSQETGDSE